MKRLCYRQRLLGKRTQLFKLIMRKASLIHTLQRNTSRMSQNNYWALLSDRYDMTENAPCSSLKPSLSWNTHRFLFRNTHRFFLQTNKQTKTPTKTSLLAPDRGYCITAKPWALFCCKTWGGQLGVKPIYDET